MWFTESNGNKTGRLVPVAATPQVLSSLIPAVLTTGSAVAVTLNASNVAGTVSLNVPTGVLVSNLTVTVNARTLMGPQSDPHLTRGSNTNPFEFTPARSSNT